jgi:hypothetical protein
VEQKLSIAVRDIASRLRHGTRLHRVRGHACRIEGEAKAHCHVYHAVHLFFGLQGESPENGSFIEFGWRLSGVFAEKVRKWRNWRLSTITKAHHWRAFLLLKKEIL